MVLICIVPTPHLLGRALTSSHRLSAFLEYTSGFEFAKAGFVSLAGKLDCLLYMMLSYFYDPSMCICLRISLKK